MKLPETLRLKKLLTRDKKGVALITVLTVMALTTILVLTFFSLATSERAASNTYSHGLHAHQVAETAVNMVIAQIRKGTYTEDPGTRLTDRRAWASQPGAIRQWENDGLIEGIYKLYSDDEMITTDPGSIEEDFLTSSSWSTLPAHYVDLNEPVIRGEKVFYPIVHPAATIVPKWPDVIDNDRDGVEGFSFDPLALDQGEIGTIAASLLKDGYGQIDGHIPMPVRWLYQLADGTVGTLSEDGGEEFEFEPISGTGMPSADNQMVARFAFWADDETAKLNLNTHAGGLAWDIPKAGGELDMAMGRYQPAQKEWQRYPGHPASTHLGPALAPGVLDIVNDRDAMEMLYRVVPRVVGGGSESGTRLIDTRNPAEVNGLVPDTEPLFPSIDDMIMRSDREPHEFPDAQGRPIPEEELSEYLERSKFFITAYNRAPEVNMFNLPKVAMWPIYNAERSNQRSSPYQSRLSPFDRLIHYCASVGGTDEINRYDYIFRRQQADSATFDYDGIRRNRELYNYLDQMMEARVPGWGAAFHDADKFGPEGQDKLLTLIFDYIRSTNLHDDSLYGEDFQAAFSNSNTKGHLTYTNPRDGNKNNKGFGHKGHGQVTPIVIEGTKGMGRFFTISSAQVVVGCVAHPGGPGAERPMYPGTDSYQNQANDAPAGRAYFNLPPLPTNARKNDGAQNGWPQWLKDLKAAADAGDASAQEEFDAAFNPAYWNWQLAFLDQQYHQAVMSDPTVAKFNRSYLGPQTISGNTRLQPGERMVQAAFLFDMFCPSIGWNGINPDMQIDITANGDMNFLAPGGTPFPGVSTVDFMGFSGQGGERPNGLPNRTFRWVTNHARPHRESGSRAWGGLLPHAFTLSARDRLFAAGYGGNSLVINQLWSMRDSEGRRAVTSPYIQSRLSPLDRGYNMIEEALQKAAGNRDIGGDADDIDQAYRYDLVTVPFKVSGAAAVTFRGGEVKFEIYDGGPNAEKQGEGPADNKVYSEASASDDAEASLVQTIEMEFPSFRFGADELFPPHGKKGWVNEFNFLSQWHNSSSPISRCSLTADPGNEWSTEDASALHRGGSWDGPAGSDSWGPSNFKGDTNGLHVRGRMAQAALSWHGQFIDIHDIVQAVGVSHGDVRLVAADDYVETDEHFEPHREYGKQKMAHTATDAEGRLYPGFVTANDPDYLLVPTLGNRSYGVNANGRGGKTPLPIPGDKKSSEIQRFGDFDNGSGTMIDGAYINKPDEGNVHALKTKFTQEVVGYWEQRRNYGDWPYFSHPTEAEAGGPAYFSPNRIVSGPGMFGSLPTGLENGDPWQTLLFRPDVVGGNYDGGHPGANDPPDHLIMDLFWMPVVEPYAISEPLATAGKVNLNYQMAPFLHIKRTTALRGVFRSEFMVCIPNEYHNDYKHGRGRGAGYHWRDNPYGGELQGKRLRSVIVETPTFDQFDERFAEGRDIFKSSTEICEIHLIPQEVATRISSDGRGAIGSYEPTVEQMRDGSYWSDHVLVGDNSRERPYANIQQRVTTKSNTFKVHYRAQVIKQSRRDAPEEYKYWRPELDSVQAEYRGSSIVERYVDPNDPDLPDFATNMEESLCDFYQFRVVNPRRFAP